MDRFPRFFLVVLATYSLALIGVEFSTSQDHVRHYFTDIEGPVRFYAVNTSVSVFLLWATALLFAVCLHCIERREPGRRLWWFFLSQILVFGFLGFDDRFKIHESAAWRLGIGDHYILLMVAFAELGLLWGLGRAIVTSRSAKYLAAAALLFCLMIFLDAIVPHDMVLRLTLEDLAKTWANVFLFAFAWSACRDQIDQLGNLSGSTSSAGVA